MAADRDQLLQAPPGGLVGVRPDPVVRRGDPGRVRRAADAGPQQPGLSVLPAATAALEPEKRPARAADAAATRLGDAPAYLHRRRRRRGADRVFRPRRAVSLLGPVRLRPTPGRAEGLRRGPERVFSRRRQVRPRPAEPDDLWQPHLAVGRPDRHRVHVRVRHGRRRRSSRPSRNCRCGSRWRRCCRRTGRQSASTSPSRCC